MTEATSRTDRGTPRALAIRSISESANWRLRSPASFVRMRSCHLRRRCICDRFFEEMERPYASLSFQSIVVVSPLSCIVFVVGAPTRDFDWRSEWLNARHSGPGSICSSSTMSPVSSCISSPSAVRVSSSGSKSSGSNSPASAPSTPRRRFQSRRRPRSAHAAGRDPVAGLAVSSHLYNMQTD